MAWNACLLRRPRGWAIRVIYEDGTIIDAVGQKAIEDMTVDELKAYAAANDIDISGLTKKDEIMNAIQNAQSATE